MPLTGQHQNQCVGTDAQGDEPGCRVERSVCEYYNILCSDMQGDAEHGYTMPGGQMRI